MNLQQYESSMYLKGHLIIMIDVITAQYQSASPPDRTRCFCTSINLLRGGCADGAIIRCANLRLRPRLRVPRTFGVKLFGSTVNRKINSGKRQISYT